MSAAIPRGAAWFASPVSPAPFKAEWEMPPSHRIVGCYFKTSKPQTSHPCKPGGRWKLSNQRSSADQIDLQNWSKNLNRPNWSLHTMDKEGRGGPSTRCSSPNHSFQHQSWLAVLALPKPCRSIAALLPSLQLRWHTWLWGRAHQGWSQVKICPLLQDIFS